MKKTISDRDALLGFGYFMKIGPTGMKNLENYFSRATEAFFADVSRLEKAGIKPKLATEFCAWRQVFDFNKTRSELEKNNINFITWNESDYPRLLKEVSNPPFILYYRGSLASLAENGDSCLAIVGSRKHSAYAEKIISLLIPHLAAAGLITVSGLALGVDSIVHQKTLDNNGITFAVLGSGLDAASIYPAANRRLADDIVAAGGLLISEFPPKTPPLKPNFPRRNRIISGLSKAVLVVEAPAKSGALITAEYALEQNREVLAVPGNIFSEFSRGTNHLIKSGAKTVTGLNDILEIFPAVSAGAKPAGIGKHETKSRIDPALSNEGGQLSLNETETIIYRAIKQAHDRGEIITADEIVEIAQLDTALTNSTLSMLELRGIAKNDGIGYDIN